MFRLKKLIKRLRKINLKISLLFSLIILLPEMLCASELSYDFKYNKQNIEVTLSLATSYLTESTLVIPSNSPTELASIISNIKFLNNNNYKIKKNNLIVQHAPNEIIKLKYNITEPKEKNASKKHPLISDNYIFFSTNNSLITPSSVNNKLPINFSWNGYKQKLITNYGIIENNQKSLINIDNINNLLFISGDINFTNINNDLLDIQLITLGKIDFNNLELNTLIEKIFTTQNEFFNKKLKEQEYIFIISAENNYKIDISTLANSIIIITNYKNSNDSFFKYVIARERIKKWFGGYIQEDIAKPFYNIWFFDGFADYYAYYLNYTANIITQAEFLQIMEQKDKQYKDSPYYNSNSYFISQNVFDPEIKEIGSLRGILLAYNLNTKIKYSSNNQKNLDGFMHYFMFQDYQEIFSNTHFINSLYSFLIRNNKIPDYVKQEIRP